MAADNWSLPLSKPPDGCRGLVSLLRERGNAPLAGPRMARDRTSDHMSARRSTRSAALHKVDFHFLPSINGGNSKTR